MSARLLTRIDTVFLPVRSLSEAVEWYRASLAWPLLYENEAIAIFKAEGGTPLTLIQHRYPGFPEIPQNDPFVPITNVYFNFHTTDIDAAHRDFESKGIEVGEIIDHGSVQEFEFHDRDGNVLSVVRC